MGRIPGINYDRSAPGPVVANVESQAAPVSQVGDQMAKLGSSLSAIGQDMNESLQKAKASNFLADAQKRLQDTSFRLKYGSKDEAGNQIAPPDPEQHEELFQKEVQDISAKAGESLGGSALRMFDSEFSSYALRHELQIKSNAMELYNSRIQANTDEALSKFATNFVDEGPVGKSKIQSDAYALIDERVADGILTPEQGLARKAKFIDDASTGSYLKILSVRTPADPYGKQAALDAIAAIDRGEFNTMNVEKKMHLREKGFSAFNSAVAAENHEMTRLQVQREKQEKETEKETIKQGLTLLYSKDKETGQVKSNLTPEWVLRNKNRLSVEYFNIFMQESSGRSPVKEDDPATVADLEGRVAFGEELSGELLAARKSGLIKTETMVRLLGQSYQESGLAITKNWKKQGAQIIQQTFFATDKELNDPVARARYGRAMHEWNAVAIELETDPTFTPEKAKKAVDEIVRSHSLANLNEMVFAKPLPKYWVGPRPSSKSNPQQVNDALKKSFAESEDAFKRGEITQGQFQRDAIKIQELRQLFPMPNKPAQQQEGQQ